MALVYAARLVLPAYECYQGLFPALILRFLVRRLSIFTFCCDFLNVFFFCLRHAGTARCFLAPAESGAAQAGFGGFPWLLHGPSGIARATPPRSASPFAALLRSRRVKTLA